MGILGLQELRESSDPRKGYVYTLSMWRTPVPGGWLLMTLNTRSNNPQPVQGFYPDPDHVWSGIPAPGADYLLRPAGSGTPPGTETLLRAGDAPEATPKSLES